ncbi:MAG: cofactor assembly of complex C subunit B [Cyanobacteriota bacterium]|nr:cofactor assembly of complex C subunit B [Cyanobacteriota bacterium]
MSNPARVCLFSGLLGLSLTVLNQLSAGQPTPPLQRSSALAALLSVGVMLVAVLWTRAVPEAASRADLQGQEGLLLRRDLPPGLSGELDWGSRMLLTATPAAVVLVLWNAEVLLRRGLQIGEAASQVFEPGPICRQVWQRQRGIHLVDLRHYPGRDEFSALLPDLPSVVVQPLGQQGLLLIGGWSARCFSSSDQSWIEGWSQRLTAESLLPWSSHQTLAGEAPASSAPVTPAS